MTQRATSAPSRAARTGRPPARRVARTDRVWSTVSTSSAARFAARVRARRRRRLWLGLAAGALVLAVLAGLFVAPWARVQRITVAGTVRLDPAQIRALAAFESGRPLLLVDTGALARRLRGLTLVASVTVRRSWPSTLAITVTERQPVAAVPDGGQVNLVDRDGVLVARSRTDPAGLPLVQVQPGAAGVPAMQAVLAVLDQLPATLRVQLRSVGAGTPDSIWFVLTDGSRVIWGSVGDTAAKIAALQGLRMAPRPRGGRPGQPLQYDVSAPDAPAVRLGP